MLKNETEDLSLDRRNTPKGNTRIKTNLQRYMIIIEY